MRESDARKDGGTYGEHTTQYDEDRYGDEQEDKREDKAQAAPAHMPEEWRLETWPGGPVEKLYIDGQYVGEWRWLTGNHELAETRTAGEALAEALREYMRHAWTYSAQLVAAKKALAQWEEAKK